MGRSKKYRVSKKEEIEEQKREERNLALMNQKKMSGRHPTPKPGHFHDSDGKHHRRNRQNERKQLKDMMEEINYGRED